MTDKLIQDILKFRDDRGWGEAHNPRNLASSIIGSLSTVVGGDFSIDE